MQNNATFLKSSFNLNGTFVQMLHFQPNFTRKPVLILYEIFGTDGLIHEGELKITESNSKKQIITFECKLDESYSCKVTGYFNEANSLTKIAQSDFGYKMFPSGDYAEDIKVRWQIHEYEFAKFGEDVRKAVKFCAPYVKQAVNYSVSKYQQLIASRVAV